MDKYYKLLYTNEEKCKLLIESHCYDEYIDVKPDFVEIELSLDLIERIEQLSKIVKESKVSYINDEHYSDWKSNDGYCLEFEKAKEDEVEESNFHVSEQAINVYKNGLFNLNACIKHTSIEVSGEIISIHKVKEEYIKLHEMFLFKKSTKENSNKSNLFKI